MSQARRPGNPSWLDSLRQHVAEQRDRQLRDELDYRPQRWDDLDSPELMSGMRDHPDETDDEAAYYTELNQEAAQDVRDQES